MSDKKSNNNNSRKRYARSDDRAAIKKSSVDRFMERHPHAYLWLSALLPVIGLLIIYIYMGIYPFGDKSVANVDMMQQYIPFYASLKNALLGGQGLSYSQSLGMGGSYWGLVGYYLTSPFAWFSLLIPNERLIDYMAFQEILRVGMTGCCFGYFYSRKFRRNDLSVPLFSVCYALSTFMTVHLCTVIWGGCLMLLPLIVLGLEELLQGKKPWLYVLCLSGAGISNYYISLMIGIYLVMYSAVFLFTEGYFSDIKKLMRRVGMFAAGSLLSVCIASGVLIPSALLLSESGNSADKAASGFWAVNPLKIIPQLLYNADNHILAKESLPLVYCSLLPVILLPLFFLNKDIPAKVKAAFGSLSGFLALSLAVNRLNYIWHGAHIPNNLPYRFAFLLVFTLLIMSGYVMEKLDSVKSIAFDLVLCGVIAVDVIAFFADGMSNNIMLVGTLLLAIAYTTILLMRAEGKLSRAASMIAVVSLVMAELTSSGVMAWDNLNGESSYLARETYINHEKRMSALTDSIIVSDSEIYRISALTECTINNDALTGHSGLSFFSSTNNGELMKLLRQTGYNSDLRVSYYYKSFTPLMDSVFNVKYVLYNQNVGNPPYLEAAGSSGSYFAYRNTLSLPRAFAVSDSLTQWNTELTDPFEVQNDFIRKAVSDRDLTVYQPLALSADKSRSYGADYKDGSVTIHPKGRMALSAVSDKRRHLYGYFDCKGTSEISIAVGDRRYSINDRDAYVMDLGWFEPEETFTVEVRSEVELKGRIYAALLDEESLESGIAELSRSPAAITEYSQTRIKCDIAASEGELLFTSIPFEKGWKVSVNGKNVEAVRVGGGLIGIPLTEGMNKVELLYTVRGLTIGLLISLMSTALAVWLLFGNTIFSFIRKLLDKNIHLVE